MPLTIGPVDKKNLAKTLTNSEELLQPTEMSLKDIAAAPDLRADEVAALRTAGAALLEIRVRREFPILGRVLDDVLSRLKDGTPPKPLSDGETRALVELMGTLSHAQNDALVFLKNRNIIQSPQWDKIVVPHRDASNVEGDKHLNKAKWGVLNAANLSSPVAAAILVSTVASGGILGMVGATAVAIGMGMTVTKNVAGKLGTDARVEARTIGMDALEGKEVASEAVLIASRLAEGLVFIDTSAELPRSAADAFFGVPKKKADPKPGEFAQKLGTEVELGTMVLNAREKAGLDWSPEEQPFIPLTTGWYYGLADLLEKHEKTPLSDTQLRQAAFELRGEVMKPADLENVAKAFITTSLAANIGDDPGRQGLVLLDHVQKQGRALLAQLQKANGVPTDETKSAAQSLAALDGLVRKELQGKVPAGLVATLKDVAAGKTLDRAGQAAMAKGLDGAKANFDDLKQSSGLTYSDATDRAKEAFATLWGAVLPSFQDVKRGDVPKLKVANVVSDGQGRIDVTGTVKHGWFGSEGSFSMKLTSAGLVDPESIKMDLGPTFAVSAAKNAVERAGAMLGKDAMVWVADLLPKAKADDPYVVRCSLAGGKKCDVAVTAMGMVDWSTVRI
jgi:hypothetical protein